MTRLTVVGLLVALSSSPLLAQGIPVFDLRLIFQMAETVSKTTATWTKHLEHMETLRRMSLRLPGMDRFRIPGIDSPAHDTARYLYARPILEALDSGNPRGEKYYSVVRPLDRNIGVFDTLPPAARRSMRSAYATVEILDATSHTAIHQAGAVRGYAGKLGTMIDDLQSIITGGDPAFHELTAILDTIATTSLTANRQNTATTQLQANVLAQRLALAKAQRDAHAARLAMTVEAIRDGGDLSASTVVDATATLRNWSLP